MFDSGDKEAGGATVTAYHAPGLDTRLPGFGAERDRAAFARTGACIDLKHQLLGNLRATVADLVNINSS